MRYFTETMIYSKPEPGHRLCLQFDSVTLQQRGKNRFTVRYGKQVDTGLCYADACQKLGEVLMHQAACDGLLDNG